MHHSIKNVATARFLNTDKLMKFASSVSVREQYSITGEAESVVSSWHVDAFVAAFKGTQTSEALKIDRKNSFEQQRKMILG